jgi:hypothetical protein
MHQHQIPANDLYHFVRKSQLPMQGCHFPREASERLGNQVAEQLLSSVSKSNVAEQHPEIVKKHTALLQKNAQ